MKKYLFIIALLGFTVVEAQNKVIVTKTDDTTDEFYSVYVNKISFVQAEDDSQNKMKISSSKEGESKEYLTSEIKDVTFKIKSSEDNGGGGGATPDPVKNILRFSDNVIKAAVVANYDEDGDGEITREEAAKVKEISIYYSSVSSLSDLMKFENLESFTCVGAGLTSVDLFFNQKLKSLNLSDNYLESLDLKRLSNLTSLNCSNNQITELDIASNTDLTELYCSNNLLTDLDVSANENLEILECNNYGGASAPAMLPGATRAATRAGNTLDVSNNPKLRILSCTNNALAALLFPSNTQTFLLETLNCSANQITVLEVEVCTNLKTLNCNDNNIEELNVENNPALENLDCSGNNIEELNVSNNPELTSLNCSGNNIEKLNVDNNPALTNLDCSGNNIEELNVSNNPSLESLNCSDNQITELDVTVNASLKVLDCSSNQISELNVSENSQLTDLDCSDNTITELDITNNGALTSVSCGEQKEVDEETGEKTENSVSVTVTVPENKADELFGDDEGGSDVELDKVEPTNVDSGNGSGSDYEHGGKF